MLSDIDRQWMKAALQEAEKGWGLCSPNPMVGAVIAEGDRELSRGFHEKAGEAHAEIRALKALPEGTDLSNATLYVTLHHNRAHAALLRCSHPLRNQAGGHRML